jgi:hypothetical protein
MKKKKVFIGIAIGAIAGGAFSNVNFNNSHSNNLSDSSWANVEALATGESNCHNINGYRKWNTSSFLGLGTQQQFYDCCTVLQTGYSPKEDCH